jgi:hypothetical protein
MELPGIAVLPIRPFGIKYLLHEIDQKLVFAAREITAIYENPRATCKEQHRITQLAHPPRNTCCQPKRLTVVPVLSPCEIETNPKKCNREPECHDHDNERMDADVTMQSCLAVVVCKIRKQIRLKRIVMVNSLQYLEIGFADFPARGFGLALAALIVNLAAA